MDMISGTLRHRGMLFAAASVVAMGLAASPASAQSETAADEGTESEIVVTGFRASLENALNAKRDSNLIIESVNAEDIGKFPDKNVAESLQRLPGTQNDRENGQGSKLRIRGLETHVTLMIGGLFVNGAIVYTVGEGTYKSQGY